MKWNWSVESETPAHLTEPLEFLLSYSVWVIVLRWWQYWQSLDCEKETRLLYPVLHAITLPVKECEPKIMQAYSIHIIILYGGSTAFMWLA